MTPAAQEAHARESIRMVLDRGWTENQIREYAAQALISQGLDYQEARRVAWRVWDAHFRTWGPV